MKTRQIVYALILMASTSTYAQIKTDRPLEDFSGVKINGTTDITLTQGEANSLNLEAGSKEEQDAIKTEIRNGVLEIISTKGSDVKINVTVKALKTVVVNGTGDIHTTNQLKADELSISSNGSGDIHIETESKKINAEVNGTGNIYLHGKTELLEASVSGIGDLKASKLDANKVVVSVSGVGSAKVNAKQSLDAKVSGVGDVVYTDEPAEKKVELNGVGSVRKAHSHDSGDKGSDTTKLSMGNKRLMITVDKDDDDGDKKGHHHHHHDMGSFNHWTGIDVGSNGFLTSAGSTTMAKGSEYMQLDYGKSFSFALNLCEKNIHLYHNYINLVTGLGFEFDHFALQKNVSLRTDSSYTTATNSSPINYRKNNLNESLLTVPLMFEFNTSSNARRSFHIAVGALGGWKIGARTRQKFIDFNNETVRVTKSNDYNLDPFRYSLTARVGYGAWTLFANYGLSDAFKSGKGPELYPFSAGINVHLW